MLTVDIKHRSFEETLLACEVLGGVDLIVTSPPYRFGWSLIYYGAAASGAQVGPVDLFSLPLDESGYEIERGIGLLREAVGITSAPIDADGWSLVYYESATGGAQGPLVDFSYCR